MRPTQSRPSHRPLRPSLSRNSSFLCTLPSPILSLIMGHNAWLSLAGCLQMSLKMHVGLKGSSSMPTTLPSNPVFIQYLYLLVIMDACHVSKPRL
ncbi:hypothetical protein BDR07DRAFT_254932 [Suillus spraguei]|nr:hypothetical protein BDR07DRAFT_254932 [Suillus spraguei]